MPGKKFYQGKCALVLLALESSAAGVSLLLYGAGIGKESVIMIFLLALLFTSVLTFSYFWSALSAISAVILFNYLFTEPRYTLRIYNSTDLTLLVFFFITAMVAASIMSRLQQQMILTSRNEKTSRLLSEVAGGFLHVTGRENVALRGISYIREHTGCLSAVILTDGTRYGGERPEGIGLRAFEIPGTVRAQGRLEVYVSGELPEERALLLQTVATQLGGALDRETIYQEREEIRIAMERERLRATLLRGVAHDLRSPLTALSGASSMLAESFDTLSPGEQHKLAGYISEEMTWLTNLVENILNMTRIQEGQNVLHKTDEVVDDVVDEAVRHMRTLLVGRSFQVRLPGEVVMLPMDGKLVAQVLINLLDNCVRHTPPEAAIELRAEKRNNALLFAVEDTGPGIDPAIRSRLFEGYVNSDKGVADGRRGMGLGLNICRAVVEAHGGRIWAEDVVPHGARFCFTLPMEDCDGNETENSDH